MGESGRWRPTRKVAAVVGALALGVALAQQPVQQAVVAVVAPVLKPAGTLAGIAAPAFAAIGATAATCPQELRQDPVFESACARYSGDFASFRAAWATATGAILKGRAQSEWAYSAELGAHVLSYDLGTKKEPEAAFMAAFYPLAGNTGEVRVSLQVR